MAHPATYVNKVLVGAADGSMQLRNINSGALLYTFKMSARICCIEPSPALDVVGVGLADGAAVLHNVKFDEEAMRFENAAGAGTGLQTPAERRRPQPGVAGQCTCLAFRCVSASGCLLLPCTFHCSTEQGLFMNDRMVPQSRTISQRHLECVPITCAQCRSIRQRSSMYAPFMRFVVKYGSCAAKYGSSAAKYGSCAVAIATRQLVYAYCTVGGSEIKCLACLVTRCPGSIVSSNVRELLVISVARCVGTTTPFQMAPCSSATATQGLLPPPQSRAILVRRVRCVRGCFGMLIWL